MTLPSYRKGMSLIDSKFSASCDELGDANSWSHCRKLQRVRLVG